MARRLIPADHRARVRATAVALAGVMIAVLIATLSGGRATAATVSGPTPTATASAAAPAVPAGFVGVDVDGPLIVSGNSLNLANQMRSMVANGVQTIRIAFNWAAAEPYRSLSQVPTADQSQYTDVDGVPVDFSTTDQVVGDAARLHIAVLPTVLYAPSWDAVHNPAGVDYPKTDGPYAAYLTALIGRYGPHGSFWAANPQIPKRPVREWQIWNEPNQDYYWRQPFAAGYVSLLRASHAAIKRADPGAKVVLGALTNTAWKALGQIYQYPGAGGLFDIAAVNGFTRYPANVILYLRYTRNAMSRFGDATKPLLATEVSWPSAKGRTSQPYDFLTTEAGQARNIAALLPMIAADYQSLHLAGFDYYTWMGAEAKKGPAFTFAGLLAFQNGAVRVKPALAAFRHGALSLEKCARKGALATDCIR